MTPEEWVSSIRSKIESTTTIDLTESDRRDIFDLIDGGRGILFRILAGAQIATSPPYSKMIVADLSSPSGVNKVTLMQGEMRGIIRFIDWIIEFASANVGVSDE